MKRGINPNPISIKEVLKGATKVARRRAFRNNLPVAVSKNGNVVYIYKDKQ